MIGSKKNKDGGSPVHPSDEALAMAEQRKQSQDVADSVMRLSGHDKHLAEIDVRLDRLDNQVKALNEALNSLAAKLTAALKPRPTKQNVSVPFIEDEDNVQGA